MPYNARMNTAAAILDLFEEYSIECPDGTINGAGSVIDRVQQVVATNLTSLRHNIVAAGDRITHVELVKSTTVAQQTAAETAAIDGIKAREGRDIDERDFAEISRSKAAITTQFAATNSVRGRSTLKCRFHAAPTPGTVPCYFLPWNPNGGAVELKIPWRGGAAASATNPILFLTAALSGCSIYVEGPANSPRIFHCGTQFDTPGANASLFWNQVMTELQYDPDDLGVAHNKDYTVPNRGTKAELKVATDREKAAKKAIQKAFKDSLDVEEVRTWGAVFGVREGANWKFYMQENCTITYYKVRKTKYLKRRVTVGDPRTYSRPMFCKEIFPSKHGPATAFRHLRRLKV